MTENRRHTHRFLCGLFFFALCIGKSLFPFDGLMWGEKKVSTIKTKWFDIIFSETSRESAELLSESADAIYDEACAFFHTESRKRFPVVIASTTDVYNAYYSPASYDHIVLFDTPANEDFTTARDNFLLMFRHELAHAVTYTMKNKFWRGVSNVFGDVFNAGFLFIPRSQTEAASILFESKNGEGRLHNPYHLQMVKQAKIEHAFPTHTEIFGSRDIFPYDTNYYFGALFHAFLAEKYGMKKLSQFFYKCVNFQTVHVLHAFKSVYGISMRQAWYDFYASLDTHGLDGSPLLHEAVQDFFSHSEKLSEENSIGARYEGFARSDEGFYFSDAASASIFFRANKDERAKKILSSENLNSFNVSADGNYLTFSETSERYAQKKNVLRIMQVKSKKKFSIKETGLRSPAILRFQNNYYLAAVKTKSQTVSIVLYRLTGNKKRNGVTKSELISETAFPRNDIVFALQDAGNGYLFFARKSADEFSFNFVSLAESDETLGTNFVSPKPRAELSFAVPIETFVLHDVHAQVSNNGETLVTFSWAAKNTLPRFGKSTVDLRKKNATCFLQDEDISGGVYNPLFLQNGKLAYSAHCFSDWKLLTLDETKLKMKSVNVLVNDGAHKTEIAQPAPRESASRSKPYRALPYYARGIFLPVSIAKTYMPSFAEKDFAANLASNFLASNELWGTRTLPIGVTYVSNNPWSSKNFIFAAGYSLLSNSGAIEANFSGGTSTPLFQYAVSNQMEFDKRIFKQTTHTVRLSSAIPAGRISRFTFSNSISLFAGRESLPFTVPFIDFGVLERKDAPLFFDGANVTSLLYSNIHKTGNGFYENLGMSAQLLWTSEYWRRFEKNAPNNFYNGLGFALGFAFPKLIPVKCKKGLTYNLPFAVRADLFPNRATFLSHSARLVLFGAELQHAVPLLYANRLAFILGYTGGFFTKNADANFLRINDIVSDFENGDIFYEADMLLLFRLELTPNFGSAATPLLRFGINVGMDYNVMTGKTRVAFGISLQ